MARTNVIPIRPYDAQRYELTMTLCFNCPRFRRATFQDKLAALAPHPRPRRPSPSPLVVWEAHWSLWWWSCWPSLLMLSTRTCKMRSPVHGTTLNQFFPTGCDSIPSNTPPLAQFSFLSTAKQSFHIYSTFLSAHTTTLQRGNFMAKRG